MHMRAKKKWINLEELSSSGKLVQGIEKESSRITGTWNFELVSNNRIRGSWKATNGEELPVFLETKLDNTLIKPTVSIYDSPENKKVLHLSSEKNVIFTDINL